MITTKFSQLTKSLSRLLVTAFAFSLLFFSAVAPSYATPSKMTEGEASLNQIQNKTDSVAKSNPRGIGEVTKEAQKGINAVQGGADKNKMISPEDTNATTVKEKAADFLEDLMD